MSENQFLQKTASLQNQNKKLKKKYGQRQQENLLQSTTIILVAWDARITHRNLLASFSSYQNIGFIIQ